MVPQDKKVRHNATRESRASTLEHYPLPRAKRNCDSLQGARSDSLQGGRVENMSDADRDAMEAREDFWNMSGESMYRHQHVMSREKKLNVPAESSTPTPLDHIDIVRQTETSLDNLEGSGSSRFRILNKRPHPPLILPGLFMDGWQIDQNACHIETRHDLDRSVVACQNLLKRKQSSIGFKK